MTTRPLTSLDDITALCALSPLPVREQIPHNMLRAMTAHGCTLTGEFENGVLTGGVLTWYGLDASNRRVEHTTRIAP